MRAGSPRRTRSPRRSPRTSRTPTGRSASLRRAARSCSTRRRSCTTARCRRRTRRPRSRSPASPARRATTRSTRRAAGAWRRGPPILARRGARARQDARRGLPGRRRDVPPRFVARREAVPLAEGAVRRRAAVGELVGRARARPRRPRDGRRRARRGEPQVRGGVGRRSWLAEAHALAKTLAADFQDADGTFRLASSRGEKLFHSPKELYDGALPSANSSAALALARVARATGDDALDAASRRCVEAWAA